MKNISKYSYTIIVIGLIIFCIYQNFYVTFPFKVFDCVCYTEPHNSKIISNKGVRNNIDNIKEDTNVYVEPFEFNNPNRRDIKYVNQDSIIQFMLLVLFEEKYIVDIVEYKTEQRYISTDNEVMRIETWDWSKSNETYSSFDFPRSREDNEYGKEVKNEKNYNLFIPMGVGDEIYDEDFKYIELYLTTVRSDGTYYREYRIIDMSHMMGE